MKDLNPGCMLMRRGRPIGLCIQRLFLSIVNGPFKYEFIGTASRCTARVLLWPLRPAQVCWSSAARKAASSLTSCLLRALRWPLPPARLPPQLALPQQGAESEGAPTAQGPPWGRKGLPLWKVPVQVGQQGEGALGVAAPLALAPRGADRAGGAPRVLPAHRGHAHEAASPPPVASPS